ncbi:hypothetical protein RQP46_007627 [Phenoliferia psychrophenolica]
MPYVALPHRNLRMYYVCNAKLEHTENYIDAWEPQSYPLDAAKSTVCFIHGPTSVAQAFTGQFADARLSQKYNLVAFDSRYHGKTECTLPKQDPGKTVCMEEMAEDFLAAIDALGLTEVLLVGEGWMGSNICTWSAIKRPTQVKALFLVSPGFLSDPEAVGDMMVNEWLPMSCRNKNGGGDGTGDIPEEAMSVVNSFFFGTVDRQGGRREAYRQHFQARYGTVHDPYEMSRLIGLFRRPPIPLELRQAVTAPVIIIQARGGADLRVITGAPHLLCLTDYSIANRFMLAFFQRSLE